MFGLDMLDLAIGMCLFFLIVSLICSAVREAVESLLKARARDLERGMRELLADPSGETLMKSLMQHGQIASLFPGDYSPERLRDGWARVMRGPGAVLDYWKARGSLPSYIPANQFATALMDVVSRGRGDWPYPVAATPITADTLRQQAGLLPSGRLQRVMLSAIDFGGNDLNRIKQEIEVWFNGSMDRVSGHYKRRTQYWLFAIGLLTAALLNLDAVTVMNRLSNDGVMREAFVAQAGRVQEKGIDEAKTIAQMRAELAALNAPVGWVDWLPGPQTCAPGTTPGRCSDGTERGLGIGGWLAVILGWIVTAVAATIGAPFWFDLLNKMMVIRSTVKPREKSREEGSEDRPIGAKSPTAVTVPAGTGGAGPAPPAATPQPVAARTTPTAPVAPLPLVDETGGGGEQWRGGFTNPQEIDL